MLAQLKLQLKKILHKKKKLVKKSYNSKKNKKVKIGKKEQKTPFKKITDAEIIAEFSRKRKQLFPNKSIEESGIFEKIESTIGDICLNDYHESDS